jgi:hypothetical protein
MNFFLRLGVAGIIALGACAAGSAPAQPPTMATLNTDNIALRSLAKLVARRIADRQKPPGYWLTSYTGYIAYKSPQQEMNTFTTSMMVEVLGPVAEAAGLSENLARARLHLSSQIEANGLVRYHGRPDAPTIASLGCVITPDSDDTALVWTLAGDPKGRTPKEALDFLNAYRTPQGLYRTWLAPRDQYSGIDAGVDPDPADIGIQLDVALFLAKCDPPAARSLCDVIRQHTDNRNWIYYELTPLVPILQAAELRRLGYAVTLQIEKLQASTPGQEIWVRASRLLAHYLAGENPEPAQQETRELLREISRDDFLVLRSEPPLFYHNDLTAKYRRFYWSEEFGYAIWLRLFLELDPRPLASSTDASPN